MSNNATFDQEIILKNLLLKFVVNDDKGSTLLTLYPQVLASGVQGLEDFLEDYLKESGILSRLEALENGETGALTENENEMDFVELQGISVVKGMWDHEKQCIYC